MGIQLRRALVPLALAVTALVPAARPAAADHLTPYCTGVATNTSSGLPYAEVNLCVSDDTGFYDPATVSCDTTGNCWARVVVGNDGTADLHYELCYQVESQDHCTRLGTGEIPLVRVEPIVYCINDNPWGPACWQ